MAAKKKDSSPPQEYICYICGEVIRGEHVYIRTRRRTKLRIHNECMNVGRNLNENSNCKRDAHER